MENGVKGIHDARDRSRAKPALDDHHPAAESL
jgi:hypothetical protein